MTMHAAPNAQHATYAPSSAHRWMLCTASAEAIAMNGEQESGEEAEEGTAAHEEIERILGRFNDGRPSNDRFAYEPNPEHPAAYGVAMVLDYVRQLPAGRMWIEQRVRLTDSIWGRCDVAHWHAESATLTIVDYKNGRVNVEAKGNEQLQIYAASSIYTHNLPAQWVRLVVVQPNSILPVPRVKQDVMSAADLFAFATRAAGVPDGPKTFTAGEHCTYCPLFGRCPSTQDVLRQLAVMLANPPDKVLPQQVAMFVACKKPVADWFKALETHQTKRALAGDVPHGMTVVEVAKHRAWQNPDAARAYIVDKLGTDALDLPTPAQAIERGCPEAEVHKMAPRPPGGPALAFESDKRPRFKQKTVAAMFAGVTKTKGE